MLSLRSIPSEVSDSILNSVLWFTNYGSPEEIQKALSTGISILRLWKRYLELKKMRLHSQKMQRKSKKGEETSLHMEPTQQLNYSSLLAVNTPWQCSYTSSILDPKFVRHIDPEQLPQRRSLDSCRAKPTNSSH